jgi:hypothetical protein
LHHVEVVPALRTAYSVELVVAVREGVVTPCLCLIVIENICMFRSRFNTGIVNEFV